MQAPRNWRIEGFSPSRGWEDTGGRLYHMTRDEALAKLAQYGRTPGWTKFRLGPQ